MKKEFKIKTRNIYDESKPFKVSRSGIELFVECPCCFYLNNRLGIRRPSGPPFNINKAVDKLLKKEFDIHRVKKSQHPLMAKYGIKAVPFRHKLMDEWRENFKGIRYLHKPTNLLITGAVDDIWVNKKGELIIVDYKATAKDGEVGLDEDWQMGYKRQMEIYQWLFRRNGFKVSDMGYFVYCNGKTDKEAFDGKIEFDIAVLPYKGDDGWVEKTIVKLKNCLKSGKIPPPISDCEFCGYTKARSKYLPEK